MAPRVSPYDDKDHLPILNEEHHHHVDDLEGDFDELALSHHGERDPQFAPPDKFNLALIIMMLLGGGSQLGFSFFMTAVDYFKYSFRNVTNPDVPTPYQSVFENTMALVSTSCTFIGLLANTFLTRWLSFKWRIDAGFVMTILVLIVTSILTRVNTDDWQGAFFVLTMLNIVVIQLGGSFLTGGLYGVQGCLPQQYASMLMIGQSVAAIFGVGISILSTLVLTGGTDRSSDIKNQAAAFFGTGMTLMILFLALFQLFMRLPVVRYYLTLSESFQVAEAKKHPVPHEFEDVVKEHFPIKEVLKDTWPYCALLISTFGVTLSVFPGLMGNVDSVHQKDGSLISNDLFIPLACMLVFNVGDLTGRVVHGFVHWPKPEHGRWTLIVSCLRIALVPLMMYCNVQPRAHLPVLFGDTGFIILVAITSFTNGYFGTMAIAYGPKLVSSRYAETTGSLMGVFLSAGCWLGAFISFGLIYLI